MTRAGHLHHEAQTIYARAGHSAYEAHARHARAGVLAAPNTQPPIGAV